MYVSSGIFFFLSGLNISVVCSVGLPIRADIHCGPGLEILVTDLVLGVNREDCPEGYCCYVHGGGTVGCDAPASYLDQEYLTEIKSQCDSQSQCNITIENQHETPRDIRCHDNVRERNIDYVKVRYVCTPGLYKSIQVTMLTSQSDSI